MKLPHLAPIKFAHTILQVNDAQACVQCTFPSIPTLSMLYEAAAQSSAAFNQETTQIGYVISVKNLELLQTIHTTDIIVHLTNTAHMNLIREFEFKIEDKHNILYAQGVLTIKLEG